MKAIRGATTVTCDSAEAIRDGVKELLDEIKTRNNLVEDEIAFLLFSNTDDIKSYYPAKAARESGFYHCPLFSAQEPDIDGALPLCIRVMVVTETSKTPVHVYLRGAAGLRKDISKRLNIALDGPAGSGKSTVSKLIAEKMKILCLDTGAMYRACALACIRGGIDLKDEKAVKSVMDSVEINVVYDGVQHTYLNGEDVSAVIRKPEISMAASGVSAFGCVREKMVGLQRKIAAEQSCILDGRDIGTNVLPNAEFKFYLTASAEVRAKRRYAENLQKGIEQPYEELLSDIAARDRQDESRKISPLRKADDAILIDSSDMSVDEVVSFIERKIHEGI